MHAHMDTQNVQRVGPTFTSGSPLYDAEGSAARVYLHAVCTIATRKRPGPEILHIPAGPDSMTSPNNQQASRYRITACRSNPQRSISVDEKPALHPGIVKGREGLVTAWPHTCGRINVPAPRDASLRRRIPRNGVDSQARVDPSREARAYTAGPTRTVQSGPHRWLPRCSAWLLAESLLGQRRAPWACAVRAIDRSRPDAARNRPRGGSADVRTSDRREPPPSLLCPNCDATGVGAPCPNAPIEMCQTRR